MRGDGEVNGFNGFPSIAFMLESREVSGMNVDDKSGGGGVLVDWGIGIEMKMGRAIFLTTISDFEHGFRSFSTRIHHHQVPLRLQRVAHFGIGWRLEIEIDPILYSHPRVKKPQ